MTNNRNLPLIVDLDGTLIHSDLLHESCIAFFLKKPLSLFCVLKWWRKGRPNLKKNLAENIELDVEFLPYDQRVIDLIKSERQKGRKIILATASHKIYAQKVAEYLQIFDDVFATEGKTNLSAHNKVNKLIKEFGERGFDYIGNSLDDLFVWQKSRAAIVANASKKVIKKAKEFGNVSRVIPAPQNIFKVWFKALRLHQWVKNFLIFVPLLASHKIGEADLIIKSFVAFILFGFCASHVYIFNDLLDLRNDRRHKTKRFRPLASGLISISSALFVSIVLLVTSFTAAFYFLPLWFGISLVSYYVLTVIYSAFLKRVAMLDIIVLAALYTMRIIAGAFAANLLLTFWILAFSMFIFLSLSLVKRYAELHEKKLQGSLEKTHGRGYYPSDLEILSSLGAASGYLSVMILALYIQDKSIISLYDHPRIIWFACPLLLYWISRIWIITHRGQMHDDPVVFAIKDRVSWLIGALLAAIFFLAL